MTVLGIDEAGRGSVFGSMFIAGVLMEEEDMEDLESLGLKDSKELSDIEREDFVPQIEEVSEATLVKEVTASEIDELREVTNLNVIELRSFASIIEELEPDKAFIDLPEPDGERFANKIRRELPDNFREVEMVAEHGADENYPIVSAASILAKSGRESHTEDLKDKYGVDFRTGYPHDEDTIDFLEEYLEEHGELPEEARLSWSTSQKMVEESEQSGLGSFRNKE
ncbi:MAG: ribonuclease HII [Candidatus Nanohaloarchaeota archaeon QJJ-7]|nr:ribonuclease HII [Candidatus Nanohaloarchaeota archaeon QJJ-7]